MIDEIMYAIILLVAIIATVLHAILASLSDEDRVFNVCFTILWAIACIIYTLIFLEHISVINLEFN